MTNYSVSNPLRLVIADDDALLRMDIRLVLEAANHEVVAEAADGLTALSAARQLRPDLVLLDVKMPGIDGIEVATVLHCERIAPVVLLTAYSDSSLVKRAVDAGVDSYLVKPFREANVLSAIEMTRARWEALRAQETKVNRLREKDQTRELVECAKKMLMGVHSMTEKQAYRHMQIRSMNTRKSMRDVAEAILIFHSMAEPEPLVDRQHRPVQRIR